MKQLIDANLRLLRVNSVSNAPLESNGVYDARSGRSEDEFKECSVGVACGDGLVVVDVDPRKGGHDTLRELIEKHGPLPHTWTVDTPRRGRHFYFKGRTRSHKLVGIDIQSDGCYVVAPPSVRPQFGSYVWLAECAPSECEMAELPAWLVAPERVMPVGGIKTPNGEFWEDDWERVLDYLSYANPNCDREQWLKIGMGLHWTQHADAYETFLKYSRGDLNKFGKRYDEYSEKACARVWRSFNNDGGITIATVFDICDSYMDQSHKVPTPEEYYEFNVPVVDADEEDFVNFGDTEFRNRLELPSFESSPLLDKIYTACMNYAVMPHHVFSYAATLSVMSAITQRGYESEYLKGKTSTYSLILGPAGIGKDKYFDFVLNIVSRVDRNLLMNEVRSGEAVKQVLSDWPSRTLTADEWPDKLINAFGRKTSQNDQEIVSVIKQVWSTKALLPGSTVKKNRDAVQIKDTPYPCLTIFAAGTIEKMRECVSNQEFLDGGLLSRLDLWLNSSRQERREEIHDVPDSLIEELSELYQKGLYKGISTNHIHESDRPFKNVVLSISADAKALNANFRAECEEKVSIEPTLNSIYDRASEKASRFATIHAIGRYSKSIDTIDMTFGIRIAKYLCNNYHVILQAAGASVEYKNTQRVARDLAKFADKRSCDFFKRRTFQIANYFFNKTLDNKQRNECLKNLQDLGFIKVEKGEIEILKKDRLYTY